MGIESDKVAWRGGEKRKRKEIDLGVEQEKVEGPFQGRGFDWYVCISVLNISSFKTAVSLFGLLRCC
jgi:hypothetical protein